MAVTSQVKPTRPQPLRNPSHVKGGPGQVEECHGKLIGEDLIPPRVVPIDHKSMDCWDNPKEAHGGEEQGPEASELARGEPRREEGGDGEDSH